MMIKKDFEHGRIGCASELEPEEVELEAAIAKFYEQAKDACMTADEAKELVDSVHHRVWSMKFCDEADTGR